MLKSWNPPTYATPRSLTISSRRRAMPKSCTDCSKAYDALREALDVRVGIADARLVQQHQRAAATRRRTASAPRICRRYRSESLREQPHVRNRVEHRARGLEAFDRLEHVPGQVAELDLRRMKERVLFLGLQVLGRLELLDVNAGRDPSRATRRWREALRPFPTSVMYMHDSPCLTPSSRNCRPSVVFPEPGCPRPGGCGGQADRREADGQAR